MKMMAKAAMAATLIACTPATASAASIMINSIGFDTPGYRTGKITHTPTSTVINSVGIGRLKLSGFDTMSLEAVSFLTFCVDIFHTLGSGVFTTPALSSFISSPTKIAQLTTLVGHADQLIASAGTTALRKDRSAAAQLAVWEIVNEASGLYDINAGAFYVTNGDSANARTLANGWLGNVTSGSWTRVPRTELGFLFNASNQSQIYLNAVPEPETWLMLILGFGLVGRAMRRRDNSMSLRTVTA